MDLKSLRWFACDNWKLHWIYGALTIVHFDRIEHCYENKYINYSTRHTNALTIDNLIVSSFNFNFGSESENDYYFLPFFLLIATIKLPLLSNKNKTHTHHRLCWIVAQDEAKRKMGILHVCIYLIFCIFFSLTLKYTESWE